MIRKIRTLILAIILIGLGLNLFFYTYTLIAKNNAKALFEKVQNNERVYVYDNYYKALNAALYVKDLKDTAALINFYSKVAKHDTTAAINFDINFMRLTLYEPIYVYKHLNKGSKIVQLIDFDKNCWGYLKGYVYIPTTHIGRPADSLIRDELDYDTKFNQDKHNQLIRRIVNKISPYGWYCN